MSDASAPTRIGHRFFWTPERWHQRLAAQLWMLVQATLFRFSPPMTPGWRRMLLRLFGARIGPDVKVHASVKVDLPWRLSIGSDSRLEHGVRLDCGGGIAIGAHVAISQYVHLSTLTRDIDVVELRPKVLPIRIGDGVWLGADVYVAAATTIGSNSVVGARASVLQDISANVIATGHPAKAVHQRSDSIP